MVNTRPEIGMGSALVFRAGLMFRDGPEAIEPGAHAIMSAVPPRACVLGHVVPGLNLVQTKGIVDAFTLVRFIVGPQIWLASTPLNVFVQAVRLGHLCMAVRAQELVELIVTNRSEEPQPLEITIVPWELRS